MKDFNSLNDDKKNVFALGGGGGQRGSTYNPFTEDKFKNNIKKIKLVKKLRRKLKVVDIINCILVGINIIICLYIENDNHSKAENAMKGINTVVVLTLDFFIILRYYLANIKNTTHLGLNLRQFISKDDIFFLAIELVICSMLSPPGSQGVYEARMLGGTYLFKIDSFMTILSLLKTYQIIRLYSHYSVWLSEETQHICKKFGFMPNLYFVMKTELKQRPFKILFLGITILSVLAALIIQACERTFDPFDHKVQDYNYFINPLWLCFVTMTTVGYGDFYPRTHMGRMAGVIICLFGMISISLLVIFLQQLIEFNPKEQKYYQDCKTFKEQLEYQKRAGRVILHSLRMSHALTKLKQNKRLQKTQISKIVIYLAIKNFLSDSISFSRETKRRGTVLQMSVEEVLSNIESKIAIDLDEICHKVDGLPKMNDRINVVSKRLVSVQQQLDEVLLLQKQIIAKFEASIYQNSPQMKSPPAQ